MRQIELQNLRFFTFFFFMNITDYCDKSIFRGGQEKFKLKIFI